MKNQSLLNPNQSQPTTSSAPEIEAFRKVSIQHRDYIVALVRALTIVGEVSPQKNLLHEFNRWCERYRLPCISANSHHAISAYIAVARKTGFVNQDVATKATANVVSLTDLGWRLHKFIEFQESSLWQPAQGFAVENHLRRKRTLSPGSIVQLRDIAKELTRHPDITKWFDCVTYCSVVGLLEHTLKTRFDVEEIRVDGDKFHILTSLRVD